MSKLSKALQAAAGNAGVANYIEDVFSTYLYTGTGSAQSINNGIDLATKGGMVWTKSRSNAVSNIVVDSVRGGTNALITNSTAANSADTGYHISSFNSNGYSLQGAGSGDNFSGYTYASWTFRKQPKFFDVVTYTGNGTSQNIAHSLGSVPGCIIVKATSGVSNWFVYHRSLGNANLVYLNATSASASTTIWNNTDPTSTQFSINGTSGNASGVTYVAYIFAHDAGGFGLTGTDNVISCGSFTYTSGTPVNLGYEPQWILFKPSNSDGPWSLADNMRSWTTDGNGPLLSANTSAAEGAFAATGLSPTSTGFQVTSGYGNGNTYIYIAIRRGPMKVPTDGTTVFSPVSYTATATTSNDTGFVNDWAWFVRTGSTYSDWYNYDRLRGAKKYLYFDGTDAEATATSGANFDRQNAAYWTAADNRGNYNAGSFISYFFSRAPSFFDEVCYVATGSARTVSHNLGVAPELIITKSRTSANQWGVYHVGTGNTNGLYLSSTGVPITSAAFWNNTSPTSSVFTVGSSSATNSPASDNFVSYLFSTCAGVSKVGSYTGNGTSQTLDCGFAAGARFVLIKRTDSTGNWTLFDTAQGIVSGTETHRYLNTDGDLQTASDTIDPDASGFIVNQVAATNLNVNAATYIFLAIA